jgi:hypothetical protein
LITWARSSVLRSLRRRTDSTPTPLLLHRDRRVPDAGRRPCLAARFTPSGSTASCSACQVTTPWVVAKVLDYTANDGRSRWQRGRCVRVVEVGEWPMEPPQHPHPTPGASDLDRAATFPQRFAPPGFVEVLARIEASAGQFPPGSGHPRSRKTTRSAWAQLSRMSSPARREGSTLCLPGAISPPAVAVLNAS